MLTREPLLKGEPGASLTSIAAGRNEISVQIKNTLPQILELAAENIIGLPGTGANTDWKAFSSDTLISLGAPARELN